MSGSFEIRADDLTGPGVVRLMRTHLAFVAQHSPPGSIHALDPAALREEAGITFWGAWDESTVVGCGALKEIAPAHGEVKSMITAPGHRRRGVASAVLKHLLSVARRRGYRRLSLETGSQPAYAPARRLYEQNGFEPCPPFGDYRPDPNSVFMTLALP